MNLPILLILLLLFLFPISGRGETPKLSDPALAKRVEGFIATLTGKDLRHHRVLEWLRPFFSNPNGAERFYLSFLSQIENRTGGREISSLSLIHWELSSFGEYAELEFQGCARFLLFFSRCVHLETSWRKAGEEEWYLLPPDSLLLELPS